MKYIVLLVHSLTLIVCKAEPIINLFPTLPPVFTFTQTTIPSKPLESFINQFVASNGTFEDYIFNLSSVVSRAVQRNNGQFSDVIGNLSITIKNEVDRLGGSYTDFIGNLTQSIHKTVLWVNGSSSDFIGNVTAAITKHIPNSNSTESIPKLLNDIAMGFRQAATSLDVPFQQFFGAFINLLKRFIPNHNHLTPEIIGNFTESFNSLNTKLVDDLENFMRVVNFPEYKNFINSIKLITNGLNSTVSLFRNLSSELFDVMNPLATQSDLFRGLNQSIDLNQISREFIDDWIVRVNNSSQIFLRDLYNFCSGAVLGRHVNESLASLSTCATNEIARLNNSLIILQKEYQAFGENVNNTAVGLSAVATATGIAIDGMGIKTRISECVANKSLNLLVSYLVPIINNRYLCTLY